MPAGRVVDRLRKDALAGTTFSHQQNSGVIGVSGLARDFEHAACGFILCDDLAEVVAATSLFHVVAHADPQGEHLAGAMQGGDQVGEVKRLDQVVVGSGLHRVDRAVHHVIGAHHEYDGRGTLLLHAAQHFDAIDAGQHNVE